MKTVFNVRKLLVATVAIASVLGAKAAAPEGYTNLGGTYSFQVNDVHANSGKWYINGEFQPVDGATIDGADWYVDNLIAFQANDHVLNLKSGTLTWTATGWGGGVYPDNNTKWLNFMPGSTLVCINPNIPVSGDNGVFKKCFQDQWSNFRYNNDKITDETRFNELFVVEAYGENGSTFYLRPAAADAVFFDTVSVVSTSNDTVSLTATFMSEGDGTAAISAAWDTEDKGADISSWANKQILGTQAAFAAAGGDVTGLQERQVYYFRLFATYSSGSSSSSAVQHYARAYVYNGNVVTGTINEWIGGEGSYNTAANWTLGHVPAESEVRWIEDGVVDCGTDNFRPNPQDMLIGGKVLSKELVLTKAGIDLKGTMFEFEVFSMNNFEGGSDFSAGGAIVTDPRVDGFWRGNENVYVNIPSNSTAILTVPFSVAATYNNFISNGKVRYMNEVIAQADFNDPEQWTVTAISDNKTSFKRKIVVAGAPEMDELTLALDSSSDTTVLVQAPFTSDTELVSATLKYGTDLGSLNQTVNLDGAALNPQDGILRFTVSGLTRKMKYYFVVVAANSAASAESEAKGIVAYEPVLPAAVWIGGVSEFASNPSNWKPAQVPTADSEVEVLDTMLVRQNIDWDLDTGVKSWTQKSFEGGSVRVTLFTTPTNAFTVSGDMEVLSGVWRVRCNESTGTQPTEALNIAVGGNLTIGADAAFHAGQGENDRARAGSGWFRGQVDAAWVGGPGYADIGGEDLEHWPLYGRGSSFGGDGGYRTLDFYLTNDGDDTHYAVPAYELPLAFTSYGKILDPLDWGSSGHGDNPNFAGGGIVKLVVGGSFTLNGKVQSKGFGYPGLTLTTAHNGTAGASTGGSINITTGTLFGSGTIDADGGGDEFGGNGSGGRIRVKLTAANATFDGQSINMHARGGVGDGPKANVVDAAAGTIALQTATDNESSGTVVIKNRIRKIDNVDVPVGATHFPSMQAGDRRLSGVKLVVEADTFVKLTRNVAVKEMTFEGDNIRRGAYTAAQLNETVGKDRFSGDGVLTVGGTGFALIIR